MDGRVWQPQVLQETEVLQRPSSCWLNQPIWKICSSNLDHFPKDWKKTYLKPPASLEHIHCCVRWLVSSVAAAAWFGSVPKLDRCSIVIWDDLTIRHRSVPHHAPITELDCWSNKHLIMPKRGISKMQSTNAAAFLWHPKKTLKHLSTETLRPAAAKSASNSHPTERLW